MLDREDVNPIVDHRVDHYIRGAGHDELSGVHDPPGPAQARMMRQSADCAQDRREDTPSCCRIVLSDVFPCMLETIERAPTPKDFHAGLRFGPRPPQRPLRAPRPHPLLDVAMRHGGSAGSSLLETGLDFLHLPSVALDEGSDGLPG